MENKLLVKEYRKGLRKERNRIINLIKKDIEFQSSKLKHSFGIDKAPLWRIEGMKLIINKINLENIDHD